MSDNMISEKTKEKLWYMGYSPNEDGDIQVDDYVGQQVFKIIYEEDDRLVLFGGMQKTSFTIRVKDLEWKPICTMNSEYTGYCPRKKNGNWPTVRPEFYKKG